MSDNTQTSWNQIAKSILAKSGDDYQTRVKPTLRSGQNKLGTLIENLGRKIHTEN